MKTRNIIFLVLGCALVSIAANVAFIPLKMNPSTGNYVGQAVSFPTSKLKSNGSTLETLLAAKQATLPTGSITTPDANADNIFAPTATTKRSIVIQARPSQTAEVFQVQDSSGGNLFSVTATGDISINGHLLEGSAYLYNAGHFMEYTGDGFWQPTIGSYGGVGDGFTSQNALTYFNNTGFHSDDGGIYITSNGGTTEYFRADPGSAYVAIGNINGIGVTKILGLPTSSPGVASQLWDLSGLVVLSGTTASNIRAGLAVAHKVSPPASASATGTAGDWSFDGSFIYVCPATNTWVRTAVATW